MNVRIVSPVLGSTVTSTLVGFVPVVTVVVSPRVVCIGAKPLPAGTSHSGRPFAGACQVCESVCAADATPSNALLCPLISSRAASRS